MGTGDGISRRNVLAGIAWTAPVIVVATAVPAAAASQSVPGGVILADLAATMVDLQFQIAGSVAYVGDADDLPVSDLLVTVRIPTARLDATAPVIQSPLWNLESPPVSDGTNTAFVLRWVGTELSPSNSITLPFEFRVGKFPSLDPVTIEFTAKGESGAEFPENSAQLDAVVGANLVLNVGGAAIQYRVHDGATNTFKYHYNGTSRWAGPYYPPGTEATDVTVTARIPAANTTGVLVGEALGPGWTRFSGPSLVGGQIRVIYKYSGTLNSVTSQTEVLEFGLVATAPGETFVTTLRTEAIAAGTTTFDQLLGPSTLQVEED